MKNMSHLRTKMFEVTYFTMISLNCGGRKEGPTPKNAYNQTCSTSCSTNIALVHCNTIKPRGSISICKRTNPICVQARMQQRNILFIENIVNNIWNTISKHAYPAVTNKQHHLLVKPFKFAFLFFPVLFRTSIYSFCQFRSNCGISESSN